MNKLVDTQGLVLNISAVERETGLSKDVSALPHAQHVLRQTGLTLDRANIENQALGVDEFIHIVLDETLTFEEMGLILATYHLCVQDNCVPSIE